MLPSKNTNATFFDHSSAQRVNTTSVVARSLRAEYPDYALLVVPEQSCDLLSFARSTGKATFEPLSEIVKEPARPSTAPSALYITSYESPLRRTEEGRLVQSHLFGSYVYRWSARDYIVYFADGRDGTGSYPQQPMYYILSKERDDAEKLTFAVGKWSTTLHDEVWMYEGGIWQKSAALFDSIKHASWEDVILNEEMKKTIIDDHMSFFLGKDKYAALKVPWKRGIIYHGPPGNGKTISIKAMMHTLYQLDDPIPTLYVRSLASVSGPESRRVHFAVPMTPTGVRVQYAGPEYSIKMIFNKARQMAPCYLIFEDLDSIVTDNIRSYFLNEVDGLKANDGVLMLGSTNHLDRLDPGISKRPSRFDRKYLFPDPNEEQRVAYCHFWQRKLRSNKDVAFPDALCPAIAGITDKFSFAYMQEAFVATLLAIARGAPQASESDTDWIQVTICKDNDLNRYILWREMKKQVKTLRDAF